MPELNKFEKSVIVITLIIGLVGGTLLVFWKFPPIVPSIFIALTIATLVYHFLGGINDASFNLGPIKLGGSIAALIASAWIINSQLDKQQINKDRDLILGRDYRVYAEDSLAIGKFKLDKIKLYKDFKVLTNDSLMLGNIESRNLDDLKLFKDLIPDSYIEVRYDLELNPFKKTINFDAFGDKVWSNYQNSYRDLPFKVEPNYTPERNMHTIIIYASKKSDTLSIASGWSKIIDNIDDNIYLVRLRASNAFDITKPYYVNYQIIRFLRKVQ